MENNKDEFIWAEKYRPRKIADCILPKEMKSTFQGFVDKKDIINLLLSGPKGIGKTTVARAMLEELDCDYIIINGSLDGNIDTLRTKITSFASSVSFKNKRKYVILDEADYLTHATQPALRNFMETFSKNCGFILTANYPRRILDALSQSRCVPIEFSIPKEEAPQLAFHFFTRASEILKNENIAFDQQAVAGIIQKYFPDWRRVLNELQKYSINGSIDSGILSNVKAKSIKDLIDFMKEKNYTGVRKWAADNVGSDHQTLFRDFYDNAKDYFKSSFIPELVLRIADYQFKSSMVLDQEINFVAFCTEIMIGAEWK